jgi:hypothetical protein
MRHARRVLHRERPRQHTAEAMPDYDRRLARVIADMRKPLSQPIGLVIGTSYIPIDS